jgi:hypothetical protein
MKHCKDFFGITLLAVFIGMFVFLAYGAADAADPWKMCKSNYIEGYTKSADTTHAKCTEACERMFRGDKYNIAACKNGCDKMHDCFLSKRDEVSKRVCASGECYSTCLEEMNYLIMGCRLVGQPFCKGLTSKELIPCTTGYEYYGISMYQKAMDICPSACPK